MDNNKTTITCQSSSRPYAIVIQENCFHQIVKQLSPAQKYLIICDSNVKPLWGDKLQLAITKANISCALISFPAGEANKNLQTFSDLHEQIALRLDRQSTIITLGGGVTGDMGGFVASTYMRGISFLQIPTSLLAMVDSSVGGKLGVDTSIGKNAVGVFNNPIKVLIDPSLLLTLPKNYFIDGMAEVIKHAFLSGEEYITFLEDNVAGILAMDLSLLSTLIIQSVQFKVMIVEQDEKESGLRKILNYGHTIGHALEETLGYSSIPHGNAVAIGINAANYLALKCGLLSEAAFLRIQNLLQQYHLPIFLSDLGLTGDADQLFHFLHNDKKNQDDQVVMILLEGLGKPIISTTQTTLQIKEAINYVIKNRSLS
ncbi:3-dehydroquinate synthase [Candidatus Lokiarchaeum ossiferum]